jgi:2,4-dienoyl-CoA reductase-like NADH-dependent reductase (Old Yellow Enzyme family)
MSSIFEQFQLGPNTLKNRLVMAPMTRSRAVTHNPDDDTVLYYAQRAGAGLIISEGTPISQEARGYAYTPGIYSREQVEGWRRVTDAVHAGGGTIFSQLWHVGRQSHVSLQPGGGAPVSSVAIAANMDAWGFDANGDACSMPSSLPRPLETDEIARVVADIVVAARNAMEAGFDGVEIHAANGYLFEQFINGALNTRADRYGGSIENRIRFVLEALDAITKAVGEMRTGIRVAPFGRFGDMHPFADEEETWLAVADAFSARTLAYVHLSDQETLGAEAIPAGFVDKFRKRYNGRLVLAGGFEKDSAEAALDANRADLIAIGRPFIANPDLVERYRNGWPIETPDRALFYTGGKRGYVDYPAYGETLVLSGIDA